MKIAFVNQPLDGILPPDQNSIGIWTYEVARRISDEHVVSVYGRSLGGLRTRGPRRVDDQGVRYRFSFVLPMRVWDRIARRWDRVVRGNRPIYSSVLYYLEFILPVVWRLRRSRPDVIHIHNFTGFVPWIRLANPRAKLVLHMNCEWLSQLDEATMARRIAKVDEVFGSSNHITGLVRERFPQLADRCHTVYNGVDPEAFLVGGEQADGDGETLVFVGRVSPEKGVHDLIDAMTRVAERRPDAQLDLIGPVAALPQSYIIDVSDDDAIKDLARFYDREYLDHLRDQGRALGDRVRYLGSMPHDDVVHHVASADLLVNPSYSESFGMSLVEAMACGTPVVATRVGGMKEIVDDRTGILVERGDPEALADAIVSLLEDRVRRADMGAAGRDRVVGLFAWDRVAEAAVGRYRAALGVLAPDHIEA